jgi:predicted O-methyltransferase YrrM
VDRGLSSLGRIFQATRVLKNIERLAAREELPIIGPEKGKVLVDTLKRYRPRQILEVCTLVGYSSILMGEHIPEDGTITTIEIDKERAAIAAEHFKEAGLSERINLLIGPALEVIPRLHGPFDMLFLDAVKDEYYGYLKASEPKMHEHAVVVADNVRIFEGQLHDFLGYVRNGGKYRSRTADFGFDAVEVSERI